MTSSLEKDFSKFRNIWFSYLLLALLQSLSALALILRLDLGTGKSVGIVQSVLVGIITILSLTLIFVIYQTLAKTAASFRWIENVFDRLNTPGFFPRVWAAAAGALIVGAFLATLTPEIQEPFSKAIFQRLFPAAALITGLGLQTVIYLLVFRRWGSFSIQGKKIFLSVLVIFAGLFAYWSLFLTSILPAASRIQGWNQPGTPLLELQLLVSWGLGIGMMILTDRLHSPSQRSSLLSWLTGRKIDLAVSLMIWALAFLIWQSIPVQPNWFLTDRVYPTREPYPTSDARSYDMVAQSALVGEGYRFKEDFNIRRPLHGLYLTILHQIADQDYQMMINLQLLVLGLFPVVLYWMGKTLLNRSAGVIAASLIVFREANSISLSGALTNANVKLLLVDLMTAFSFAVFFFIAIYWLQKSPKNPWWAVLTGQALGLAILLRPEAIILIAAPIWVLYARGGAQIRFRHSLRQSAVLLFGVILTLSPWVWRNWDQTGMIYLNDPYFRFGIIQQRFGPQGLLPPAETEPDPLSHRGLTAQAQRIETTSAIPAAAPGLAEKGSILSVSAESPTLPQTTPTPPGDQKSPDEVEKAAIEKLQQELSDPIRLIKINSAHYLNSQIQTLLVLPSTFRGFDALIGFLGHRTPARLWSECCSSIDYIRRLPYWPRWQGDFALQSTVPFILNILILAAGIQIAWNKRAWIGLIPLVGAVAYLGGNAIFRNSGGRYILPVDWVFLLYFSLGLAQISLRFSQSLGWKRMALTPPDDQELEDSTIPKPAISWLPGIWIAAMLFLSLAIPFVERSFPQRYTDEKKEQMIQSLLQSDLISSSDQAQLQGYLDRGITPVAGRILYPQYYHKNVGSLGKVDAPIKPMPFPRLVFSLSGERNLNLILPVEPRPDRFQNASDGLVFLCEDDDYALAMAIFSPDNDLQSIFWISPEVAALKCPESNKGE